MKKHLVQWVAVTTVLSCALVFAPRVWARGETPKIENHWFVFGGIMNYHTRLEESEAQIDRQINDTFRAILPRWREPETFKDWSDEWRLWDGFIGFGRDFAPKWDWCVDIGGGVGTVKNRNTYYPLGLRMKSAVDFTRTEAFIEGAIDYYPWGKPVLRERPPEGSGMTNALRSTKPYLSPVSGYNHQTAEANVRLKLPLLGDALNEKQRDVYDLFYICPRISAETPITERDFLNFTAGYVFFTEHSREFNSVCVGVFWKHKF